MRSKYIGDRLFYKRVLSIVIPIIIQNFITNFVSLLDNIMVGQVGTLPMSGVSIVNQLLFVFNLCVFGASSGAGIFTAQFHGSGDHEGVRNSFRFKLIVCLLLGGAGTALFWFARIPLIQLYLTGDGSPEDAAQVLSYGIGYLRIMLIGLLPFSLSNAYSGTLKETGQTFVPMVGGIAAVFVNLVLNYVFIFGHFGFPAMGVEGAAWATVISRFVELAIVAGWAHLNPEKNRFIVGVYRSMRIPGPLAKNITIKGMPLLVNEFFWSSGMAMLNQCYSTCGLDVVPAMNIAVTLTNLTNVVYMSNGIAVGIIIGQMLGARVSREEVKDASTKLIFISVVSAAVFGIFTAALSGVFPQIYNTTQSVRVLAGQFILITALFMPFQAYTHAGYFTLRSGGKTFITFLFDSGFVCFCCVPLAFCLSRFTAMAIVPLYFVCQTPDILRCLIGWWFLQKGTWIQNLT